MGTNMINFKERQQLISNFKVLETLIQPSLHQV